MLIVGHPLNDRDRHHVYSTFRTQNAQAPIIQVVTTDERAGDVDCIRFNLYDGPEVLLAILNEIFAGRELRAS